MVFSDLEVVAGIASRTVGYVRDNVFRVWATGAGKTQHGYSPELAGAMHREADEFFDRALALYLLRTHLRVLQASTWGDIGSYYSNYFSATSFLRLHLTSVSHLPGQIFEIEPDVPISAVFKVSLRGQQLRHTELWKRYYKLVNDMGWPDAATVVVLSPTIIQLKFREQLFRERINYRAGEGFDEIYLTPVRYARSIRPSNRPTVSAGTATSDAIYNDHLARERLRHVGSLLVRLRNLRIDTAIEETAWERRRSLVARFASNPVDRKFAREILGL
ncbi:MAG TPA: hypothetical protein VN643_26350 [Pyrinomonadaceae bacterium]|nr:hypothetical protein [Pyrinomonadaceae bacterium]